MSRVGKKPVVVPAEVKVEIDGQRISIKGKTAQLSVAGHKDVAITLEGNELVISPRTQSREARAAWGLVRNLVSNAVKGVSEGFQKTLEITGVGYRAAVDGGILSLSLGYSHEIRYAMPENITVKCPKPTTIEISGADMQKVGQIAAEIRSYRPPEPYKGKGIKYDNEIILRKEGKKK